MKFSAGGGNREIHFHKVEKLAQKTGENYENVQKASIKKRLSVQDAA